MQEEYSQKTIKDVLGLSFIVYQDPEQKAPQASVWRDDGTYTHGEFVRLFSQYKYLISGGLLYDSSANKNAGAFVVGYQIALEAHLTKEQEQALCQVACVEAQAFYGNNTEIKERLNFLYANGKESEPACIQKGSRKLVILQGEREIS